MTNTSMFADPDPVSAMWLGLLYAVYASIGIPANILVLVLSLTKNVRIHPINICIFSIALSDMMLLVSTLSSTLWALTNDMTICKVGGVGMYMFNMLSMTLPSCLSLCRHVGLVREEQELHPILRPLRRRSGILLLNGMYWTYGLLFTLPFILTDRMGMDAMGFCGIAEINSVLLWAYYVVFICGVLFSAYLTTFIFYRKLSTWVKTTTSMMTATPETNETLALTRSIMRMIRWILFVPVVYHPALILETAMRLSPNLVSISIARIFLSTCPLPHVIDPFITILFVRCYRSTLTGLICRGRTLFKHSVYPIHGMPIVKPQSNAPKSLSLLVH